MFCLDLIIVWLCVFVIRGLDVFDCCIVFLDSVFGYVLFCFVFVVCSSLLNVRFYLWVLRFVCFVLVCVDLC